ncbi:uncharacterized protein LOC121417835 [Lytechinus variegatus]|uniref:uncharacterized protein LOC121417835 n=1 Tax=Lytechinus variegatus TaxID=7654 RepID=UPI001BB1CF04|nr:uncharacterized protein LOC121417835 [Lytechinus variegatus]
MEKMNLIMVSVIIFTVISNSFLPATAVPSFDVEPRDVDVVEGELATFWCTVADRGDANIYWLYVDGEGYYGTLSENEDTQTYAPLHGELTQRISIKGDFNNGVYNLFIKNVTMSDQKQYFCSAITQDYVSFHSRKARLTVRPRTRPEDPLHACSARAISPPNIFNVGTLVRFTCATPTGFLPQTLTWNFMENGIRSYIASCPESPCIHNRLISIDDVNRTFVCELGGSILNQVECTYTPLQRQVEVVVDPPLFKHPPGIRQGFVCLPVNYDPNNLLFEWYHNSELIPNGTGHSFLNLMISREYAGSTVSCLISSLDGSFRGMGQARIEPFDPSESFSDAEGSFSPPLDQGCGPRYHLKDILLSALIPSSILLTILILLLLKRRLSHHTPRTQKDDEHADGKQTEGASETYVELYERPSNEAAAYQDLDLTRGSEAEYINGPMIDGPRGRKNVVN